MTDKITTMTAVVNEKTKTLFKNKVDGLGYHSSHVHRELLVAFVEGRVSIEPPSKNVLHKLYNKEN